jgi:hypothetical protein
MKIRYELQSLILGRNARKGRQQGERILLRILHSVSTSYRKHNTNRLMLHRKLPLFVLTAIQNT